MRIILFRISKAVITIDDDDDDDENDDKDDDWHSEKGVRGWFHLLGQQADQSSQQELWGSL